MHRDAQPSDAGPDVDDASEEDDAPAVVLNLGDAAVAGDVTEDVTPSDAAGGGE
jgi:hypothetical protein